MQLTRGQFGEDRTVSAIINVFIKHRSLNLLYFSGHRVKHYLYYTQRRCPHDKKEATKVYQRIQT